MNDSTLWDRIRSRCVLDNDCLVWQGATSGGYGRISVRGEVVSVHRTVYEMFYGPILAGLQIDHVKARGCHSRACCNIEHLEVVTRRENILRGVSFSAKNAVKTHCPSGHALVGTNLRKSLLRRGERACRICHAARNLARLHNSKVGPPNSDVAEEITR